ncbi:hypothetical protein ACFE04_031064 [Oxalis oulophora]
MDSFNQNSGLLRFRSAPANFSDNIDLDGSGNTVGVDLGFRVFDRDKVTTTTTTPVTVTVTEPAAVSYGLPPHYPRQQQHNRVLSSIALMEQHSKSVVNSSLMRQSSSPAGLFAHLNQNGIAYSYLEYEQWIDHVFSLDSFIEFMIGYASEKGLRNFNGVDTTNEELSPSTKRLKSQLSFPSRLSSSSSSSLGILPQISEIGNEGIGSVTTDDENIGSSNGDARFFSPGFTFGPWNGNEPSHFADNNAKLLFSDSQNGDIGNRFQPLSHHLSLPKTFSHINQAEKFLQFQDSVPCKIRAKRGCATHPRSIAERVRRTRISERMRKLQELVPNMDKQTNTSDMLEYAVDYIKDLQRQYKTLSDSRAKCKCLSMQKLSNQIV